MGETSLGISRFASMSLHDDASRTELNGKIESGLLSGTELHAVETKCYAELHVLRDEMDLLLNELRDFVGRMNDQQELRQAA